MPYDVAIIGAGSAGLFAALELARSPLHVVVLESGLAPKERTSITSGVGGGGTFSDGKLNLSPRIGGNPQAIGCSAGELQALMEQVDQEFTRCGAPAEYSGEDVASLNRLRQRASQAGIEFISGRQRHIGTRRVREVIDTLYRKLIDHGIEFRLDTRVTQIAHDGGRFQLMTPAGGVEADRVIAAPGRVGAYWLREQARELGVGPAFGPLDIGVRVEFPAELYEPIEQIMYDAKFRLRAHTYDDSVRTFCTNPRGFVVREDHESFALVNGHAENERKSDSTNFALLVHIELTNPVEDTTQYGRAIAQLASTIGGGRPIVQRLKDLQQGHRSTEDRIRRSSTVPTLSQVTPGDLSMALPQRIVVDVLEAIERLDRVIPGLDTDSTLLYAPEIKFYDTRYAVGDGMETSLPGFHVAGDASGHSRGIVFSAVTGLYTARHILSQRAGDPPSPRSSNA